MSSRASGIIYEYEDGGKYCGEWDNDQAHGYGVCTGPEGKGLFEGRWVRGNQARGVFMWPTGQKYTGTWEQGVREGTGLETKPGGTEYSGEFTRDARGPHGVLRLPNGAVYSGMWSDGVQDGEGVETYADRGIYRGQYKNGVRHGYGTRSSAAYEHGEGKQRASDPATGTGLLKKASQASMLSGSFRDSGNCSAESLSDENSQIYEGEWKDDKRHGHGVLKVSGHYTYYGEWECNARTGYGVLVHRNRRKEEGQWQRGRLVSVLRRKKLTVAYLKGQSMEGKVKQAHTLALQAAGTARNDKAMLAESKAQLSRAKDMAAQKTAQQALKDAQVAKEKAELYKNAPRVAEGLKSVGLKSQVSLDFPAIDTQGPELRSTSKASSTDSSGFLTLGKTIAPTPSYEDIHNLQKQDDIQPWNGDSDSESNGSTDPIPRVDSDLHRYQHWEDVDVTKPIPRNRRAWYRHQHRPHSAKNSLDHSLEQDSFESISSMPDRLKEEAERLLEKRRKLLQMRPASDGTFNIVTDRGEKRVGRQHQRLQRRASDKIQEMPPVPMFRMRSKSLSDPDEEVQEELVKETERYGEACPRGGVASGSRKARRRKTTATRDKTTGEIGHGDATDDELLNEDHKTVKPESVGQRSKCILPLPPHPLVKKPSMTMDMLTQMADWNKMVAYINFGLLIFLLLLIIIVVMGMNYYYLSHNMSMPQQNPGFMTPMA